MTLSSVDCQLYNLKYGTDYFLPHHL